MEEPRDFATGLLVGALVGVGIGLMFAPARGEIMRERMRQRGEELLGRARDVTDRAAGQVSDAIRRGQDMVNEAAEGATEAASRMGQQSPSSPTSP
jgi:gas vesicle protein